MYHEVHIIPRDYEEKIVSSGGAMNPLQTLWTARAWRLRVGRARRCIRGGRRVWARGGGVRWRVGQGPALDVGGDIARLGREWRHRDGGQE
ncbi:hypothetical protein C2845_PM14G17680 [Panicum miliaceum]|uniref:Uncharacterized protein n=1 Tax=Panicum miliaceum TaxID=4540 RepID=A0A3L6PLR0_PANMI|nr:hypothetical protein C2845_PM14G17680 [Panicum miliaceum]